MTSSHLRNLRAHARQVLEVIRDSVLESSGGIIQRFRLGPRPFFLLAQVEKSLPDSSAITTNCEIGNNPDKLRL